MYSSKQDDALKLAAFFVIKNWHCLCTLKLMTSSPKDPRVRCGFKIVVDVGVKVRG